MGNCSLDNTHSTKQLRGRTAIVSRWHCCHLSSSSGNIFIYTPTLTLYSPLRHKQIFKHLYSEGGS